MNETEKRDRRDEKEEIRYHVIFYGQVQGVGFRYRDSQGVKMVLMYTVSAAITLAGGILVAHDRRNKAFLGLLGCGMGAWYLSLFLSDFYFHAINDGILYLGLLVWWEIVTRWCRTGTLSSLRTASSVGMSATKPQALSGRASRSGFWRSYRSRRSPVTP